MNQEWTKHLLTGCVDGLGIKVTTNASPGDLIHTAHATALDEIVCYVVNTSASAVKIVFQVGGTTAVDNDVELTVPAEGGAVLSIPAFLLTNSKVLRAWAGTANVLVVYGHVNRITTV